MKNPFVYIMASERNGTLYIGVTSSLPKRIWEHKNNVVEGFTQKHKTHMLVYYEPHKTIQAAIVREKQLKEWHRLWKLRIIEEMNPDWDDLFESIAS